MYPKAMEELIESLKSLPGVGGKTAERYCFSIMQMDNDRIDVLLESIKAVKSDIHKCSVCNSLTDSNICNICDDEFRDSSLLCVVEDYKSVVLFEKLGTFKGMYHVLDSLINPSEGVNPEDIGLDKLLDRIKTNNFKEIIIAVKQSIEGETTSLYISRLLDDSKLSVTRLASGIPMGADMEYVDIMTLERAINDRKKIA